MNHVAFGGHAFRGPKTWANLTPKQFRQVLRWRVQFDSDPAGRYVLLERWYGIRYRQLRLLNDEQRADLVALLDFLDERPSRWMLPDLRIGGRRYVGPGDDLEHLTFGEFMFAQAARERYADGQDPADLGELVAALYRPKAWPWQAQGEAHRRLFDQRRLKAQTARMQRLPVYVQLGILMNFDGCMATYPAQFEHLFKGSAGSEDAATSWLDVGINLARSTGALGTFEQLERTNLYLVLTTLDAIMKENEALKEKWNQ